LIFVSSKSLVEPDAGGHSRRAFLQSSGGLAGAVAVSVMTPAAVIALESTATAADAPVVPVPRGSGPLPDEPVMAYVSDPARGEVTVLSGTQETTFRDPALARRLLKAARSHVS
jgi:hypothetical protein